MNVNTEEFRELTEEENKMDAQQLFEQLADKHEVFVERLTKYQKEHMKLSKYDHNSVARKSQREFMKNNPH